MLIEQKPKGFFLYRYTAEGVFAGDTWHMTLADAKYQAEQEYRETLGEWKDIPATAGDAQKYALRHVF